MLSIFDGYGKTKTGQFRERLHQALRRFTHGEKLLFRLGRYGNFDRLTAAIVQKKVAKFKNPVYPYATCLELER